MKRWKTIRRTEYKVKTVMKKLLVILSMAALATGCASVRQSETADASGEPTNAVENQARTNPDNRIAIGFIDSLTSVPNNSPTNVPK